MPKHQAEIWGRKKQMYDTLHNVCHVLPKFRSQNSVEKLMKRCDGEIVIFELHTT